jgi:hypothetical protein
MGEVRNAYRIFVRESEGKTPCWRGRHRGEDNIKIDLKQVGCEDCKLNSSGSR